MPVTITCPHCRKQLQMQEAHLGKQVRCPACQKAFAAEASEEEVPDVRVFEVPEERSPVAARASKRREEEGSLDFTEKSKSRGRSGEAADRKPHRGALILVLGLLGFFLAGCPLAGWILGGLAMKMGAKDVYEMAFGRMDRSGQGMTQVGKIFGMVTVVLSSISGIFLFVRVVMLVVHFMR